MTIGRVQPARSPDADTPLEPWQLLAVAVLRQALSDARCHPEPRTRDEARRFFAGWPLTVWCGLAGLDVALVRQLAAARLARHEGRGDGT